VPDLDEAITLSAQHLTGREVDDEGTLLFRLTDGDEAVDLTHEIGDPEAAAAAMDRVAAGLRAHAERIRARVRLRSGEHGPWTGPVAWPRS
jgi:hypothetical protein